jgi:hypothetical protein
MTDTNTPAETDATLRFQAYNEAGSYSAQQAQEV